LPRFRLDLEYAGTRYRGWQVQKNARTVQGELIRAASAATGRPVVELQGAGRTDAGVHALHQVAHLETEARLEPETLRQALNDELPADINVLAVSRAPHRFHARHAAVARAYLYQISRRRTALAKPFVWWVRDGLSVQRMREAAVLLQGFHDFRSFTDADPEDASTKVHLEAVEVAEAEELLLVRVLGSHFLWKMARRMVGVLAEVGRGAMAPHEVARLLREPSEAPAALTAPPSGLFLERVFYEGDEKDRPLRPAVPVLTFRVR
jgi:tRNA pseudouridine38-40 synthase